MPGTVGSRLRRVAILGVVVHALVVAAAPFEHHDLICHLKTPQHCTSCAGSPVGSSSDTPASTGAARLAEAGRALAEHVLRASAVLTARTTGRSPPAAA